MRNGVVGGLCLCGLVVGAILNLAIGLILIGIGAGIAALGEVADAHHEQAERESWLRQYPPYGY